MKKDMYKILKELHSTFPPKFMDDFATNKPELAGPHYEAIEDHLKTIHKLSTEEVRDLSLFLYERNK